MTPPAIHGTGRRQHLKRLAASAAAAALAVLGAVSFATSPAMASSTASSLPDATYDNGQCATLGTVGAIEGVLCISLGLYTTSTGEKFVTAQVDGWCANIVTMGYPQCSNIVVNATVANGAGYTGWTTRACGHSNGNCQSTATSSDAANNFFPFGGLEITAGSCDYNVWVVINTQGTDITLPGSGQNVYLSKNLEDGHFNEVCLWSNGVFTTA